MLINDVNKVKVGNIVFGGKKRFVLIAGPCVMESQELMDEVAGGIKEICDRLGIEYIFKASFDKANRSSIHSYRGPGLEEGMKMLAKTKEKFNIPVITDVHEAWQCKEVAKVADILQIPAFLCRQTDLLIAAAETGKAVNIKKGQFLAPWDMKNIVVKMEESGNKNIMLCERDREYVYPLLRAGLAIGVDAIFAEVHPNPTEAKSDGPNMLYLKDLEEILKTAIEIDKIVKGV